MQITVSEEQGGKRLDQLASEAMPTLSRAFVQKLCKEGKVLVNGVVAKPGHKLHTADHITVDYDESKLDDIAHLDLPILYEDDDCVVINKPAGILAHALGKHGQEPSVASFLRHRQTPTSQKPPLLGTRSLTEEENVNSERAGIVHRLDRATSGVMIGAKNQAALSWLQKQFSARKVKKTYVAIVEGTPKEPEAIIDMPIERNPKAPATFRVGPNGKSAVTRYKVLQAGERRSLLELRPESGRTHQLRVHLAKIGHPIVGDPLYGKGKYGDRLFLHALSLEITLLSRERKVFSAPLPAEFQVAPR